MDLKDYISSGVIEDYCLGILNEAENRDVLQMAQNHTEVQQAIEEFRQSLETYGNDWNITPPPGVKQKVLQLLDNLRLEEEKNLDRLPLLNKYTDHRNWLDVVEPVLPETLNEKMFVCNLRNDESVSQTLIWTKIDYPDEVHEDLQECFIILRGNCRCYIGDEVVELGPGGFVEIPMYAHHNVRVLGKEPVLAVVQRVKVA